MKLKDMSKEELEMLSYAEIAVMVLEENNKKMKVAEVFSKICNLLGLTQSEYENRIADFYELISTNKSFIILPEGYVDLKSKHNTKVIIDEEDEEVIVEEVAEEEIQEDEEDIFSDIDEDDDTADDDLQDFVVYDSDDEANS